MLIVRSTDFFGFLCVLMDLWQVKSSWQEPMANSNVVRTSVGLVPAFIDTTWLYIMRILQIGFWRVYSVDQQA